MSDYNEIIRLFQNVKDNADDLVNLFKILQAEEKEEKEVKNDSLIRWRKYPEKKPDKGGLYFCAMKKDDYKCVEQCLYNKESDVWTDNVSFSRFPITKVYGVAPSAWAIIDFPDLEEEND